MQEALRAICPDSRGRGSVRGASVATHPLDPTMLLGKTA